MDSFFEIMELEGFVLWGLISSLILFGILFVIFVAIRAFYHHQVDKSDGNYVSAKYCYVTRKLRLHQNDRCKRFPLF